MKHKPDFASEKERRRRKKGRREKERGRECEDGGGREVSRWIWESWRRVNVIKNNFMKFSKMNKNII